MISDFWNIPASVTENNFIYKSLSSWACNVAVGCEHACRFCYVPSASTGKGAMADALEARGVKDPDEEWGDYVFVRPWNETKMRNSIRKAEQTPRVNLNADGNRAVMFCTTTDAYQVIRNADKSKQLHLQAQLGASVRGALEMILEESTLNVRILTRSPLARQDFDLMKRFGNRLLFGMSLPTLRNDLSKLYEPKAPSPSRRMETLIAAKEAGIPVYVAVAPVYPDCDKADMAATLAAVVALRPVTIFMEPINIRADNVARIEKHAASLGMAVKSEVFKTPAAWSEYAFQQLQQFEDLALEFGVPEDVLHLWPDQTLERFAKAGATPTADLEWLRGHWNKISRWPN